LKTLIISDLHLGNRWCDRSAISGVLNSSFDKLIVNGDIVDYKGRMTSYDKSLLEKIKFLAQKGKAILISGNHEAFSGVEDYLKDYLLPSYHWNNNGFNVCVIHGHQFCSWFSKVGLKRNAVKFAQDNDYQVVIVGHNHQATLEKINSIVCLNTGSFTGLPMVGIITSDSVRLQTVDRYLNRCKTMCEAAQKKSPYSREKAWTRKSLGSVLAR